MVLAYADLLFVLEPPTLPPPPPPPPPPAATNTTTTIATTNSPAPVSDADAHVALAWAIVRKWCKERDRRRGLEWRFGRYGFHDDGLSAWRSSNWPGDPRERSIRARHQRRHRRRHQALQTALQAELSIVSAHFTLERRCHRALQTALRVDLLAMVAIVNTKRNKRIAYRVLDPELLCDIRAFDRTSRLRVHSPVRCGWGARCLGVVEGTLALAPWLTRLCLLCGRPMATPRRSPVLPLHCRCRLTHHINIIGSIASRPIRVRKRKRRTANEDRS